jgi:hypothetical protein
MLLTGFSAFPWIKRVTAEYETMSLAACGRHHGGSDGSGPVGPGLADIGKHRGDLSVVQFILPGGHLAQAALAAIEDGGNHRFGVAQDKGVFIQGREGGRESLAIGAMALGAIVLKDRLALLDGVALTLGQSDAAQQT